MIYHVPDHNLTPPEYEEPIEFDDVYFVAEVQLEDEELTVSDGNFEFIDPDPDWSKDHGYPEWEYEDDIRFTVVTDSDVMQDVIYLIDQYVPYDDGTYEISAKIKLVYHITNITGFYDKQYDEVELNTYDMKVKLDFKKSSVSNLLVKSLLTSM